MMPVNKSKSKLHPCLVAPFWMGVAITAAPAQESSGGVFSGRALDGDRTFSIRAAYGQIDDLEGSVRETKRASDEAPGESGSDYLNKLENYSLEELGIESSAESYGLQLEKQWRFFTLQIDFSSFEGDANTTAAKEPFAIGVDNVDFRGNSYDYMLIPQGSSFSTEYENMVLAGKGLITPLHIAFAEGGAAFSPWMHLGFLAARSEFSIDAGPTRGLTQYESGPYSYVVGGQGDGSEEIIVPEIGFGGELRMIVGHNNDLPIELVFQGDFALLDFAGSTGDFGVDARNAKDVDMDYTSIEFRGLFEFPVNEGLDFVAGVTYRVLDAVAEVESQHKSSAAQNSREEKYDKEIEFQMSSLYGVVGVKF